MTLRTTKKLFQMLKKRSGLIRSKEATAKNVAIKKPNGQYLTVLFDGTDAESNEIFDQETFLVAKVSGDALVLTADRTTYQDQMAAKGGARSYSIAVTRADSASVTDARQRPRRPR